MPTLFDPFRLKDIELRNRIAVAPMCQYSAEDGVPNDWHLVHLGARAAGGAGLVIAEGSAVSAQGRITLGDAGLWNDAQAEGWQRITAFIKRHAVPGIQLAHAGRKASAHRPWDGDDHIAADDPRAWDTMAPSPIALGGGLDRIPREMTDADIAQAREEFVAAAKRALGAGFEWLELHFAHGFLVQSFFSPLANHRRDGYGGSAEGRARFPLEVLAAVRDVWPERLPLSVRLGVTDFHPGEQPLEESIALVRRLKSIGLDLVDVSLGFNTPDVDGVPWGPGFMVPIAERIRREAAIATAAGWRIGEPRHADAIVRNAQADLILLAHAELSDPHWPYRAAHALGLPRPHELLPIQYAHWLNGREPAVAV
ncbi:2,4-dienoyl-CoA reductase [Lysobacter sp. yr284]|uniref:NADH:flavin oxidoreductase/NADH oxidase n=1 Tax=Lysobacter TaxID=68 RepID=UPI00089699C1|nr:NADH:flavin oxidoreductase/NADH oxidase [Lysobacter sp. yr284]SDY57400.1 2,4-dienoyl-CoA reductase [Lysobacter sp. yr284]